MIIELRTKPDTGKQITKHCNYELKGDDTSEVHFLNVAIAMRTKKRNDIPKEVFTDQKSKDRFLAMKKEANANFKNESVLHIIL